MHDNNIDGNQNELQDEKYMPHRKRHSDQFKIECVYCIPCCCAYVCERE